MKNDTHIHDTYELTRTTVDTEKSLVIVFTCTHFEDRVF